MKKLIPYLPQTPASFVTAVCDSLVHFDKHPLFQIDLDTRGRSAQTEGKTFGDASSTFFQHQTGQEMIDAGTETLGKFYAELSKRFNDPTGDSLLKVGIGIDRLIKGNKSWYIDLYEIPPEHIIHSIPMPWVINNENWRTKIAYLRAYAVFIF